MFYIKNNPSCSFTDIHYFVQIDVKNVYNNCLELEKEGLIKIERKRGKARGKVKCFLIEKHGN